MTDATVFEPEALSALIGQIYDCAIDPERWAETLPVIMSKLNCCNAVLALNELPSARYILFNSHGITDFWMQKLPDFSGDILALWQQIVYDDTRPLDEPATSSRDIPPYYPDWQKNRYVTEWAAPQGIADSIVLICARSPARVGNIGFGRHQSAGPIGEGELRLMRLLAPHIRRAVTISDMLETATVAAATFETTLDSFSAGVFLVDARGQVVHANRAGKMILERHDPVRLRDGALKTWLPATTSALENAIALASQSEIAIGRAGIGVPAPSKDGPGHLMCVLPLPANNPRRGWMRGAVAAVFVSPSSSGASVPVEALTALYDLTPAEARVMLAVAGGKTPAETAQTLGVGESTVRTHLLKIFAKTGTARQAELPLLISSLTLPVGGSPA